MILDGLGNLDMGESDAGKKKEKDREMEKCRRLNRWADRFVFIYFGCGGALTAIAGIVLIILGLGG